MIPYPQGLTFEEWAAFVVEQFASNGVPVFMPLESEWETWAERLQEVDATEDVPDPRDFEKWQDWAERVVDSLN